MKTKKEFTVFEHIDINTPLLLVSGVCLTSQDTSVTLCVLLARLYSYFLLLMIWVSSTVPGLSNWSSGPPRPHICSFPAQNTPVPSTLFSRYLVFGVFRAFDVARERICGLTGSPWGPRYQPLLNRVYLKYSKANKSQDTNIVLLLFFLCFLQSPQAGTKDKTLCCWFCTSGPISLSAKIERKGYTPGNIMFPSMICISLFIKRLVLL